MTTAVRAVDSFEVGEFRRYRDGAERGIPQDALARLTRKVKTS
jgi:hypothetical protein